MQAVDQARLRAEAGQSAEVVEASKAGLKGKGAWAAVLCMHPAMQKPTHALCYIYHATGAESRARQEQECMID